MKRKLPRILWICLIVAWTTGCYSAEQRLERGVSKRKEGNFQAAVEEFTQAIELNPNYAQAYAKRGAAFLELQQIDAGLQDINRAIELDPKDYKSFHNRATAKYREHKFDEAISDLTHYIDLNAAPKAELAYAYVFRGAIQLEQGHVQEALVDVNRGIELDENVATGFFYRGRAYEELGDIQSALQAYTSAIDKTPAQAHLYVNRGAMFSKLRRYANAVADYNKALALEPKLALALYNRAIARQELGELKGAIADLEETVASDPKMTNAYIYLSKFYRVDGQQELANEMLGNMVAVAGDDAKTNFYVGAELMNAGRASEAVLSYSKAIQSDPNYADAYFERGRANQTRGSWPSAKSDYEHAASLSPKWGEVLQQSFPRVTCGWNWVGETKQLAYESSGCTK